VSPTGVPGLPVAADIALTSSRQPRDADVEAGSAAQEPGAAAAPAPSEPPPRGGRGTLRTIVLIAVMVGTGLLAMVAVTPDREDRTFARPEASDVVVVGTVPLSWDPARIADSGSAQLVAQVFEGLTVLDADDQLRPGLADGWSVSEDGLTVTFRLRPGITFSDGSPITGHDVRRSWLRVLDPERPSPLASLLSDVRGADDRLAGRVPEDEVAITSEGDLVRVEFIRPAAWFPALVASPTLAVVPPAIDVPGAPGSVEGMAASGAYTLERQAAGEIRLRGNPAHWAGSPALERVTVLTELGGRSPVEVFEDGAVDWTHVYASDVPWLRYDTRLGPQLREMDALAVDLLGFDTTRPPFDDAHARRAIALAVDWRRIAALARPDMPVPSSIVPPGIPGRPEGDLLPPYDPGRARAELRASRYGGPEGFPSVTLSSYGVGQEAAIALELERELGIDVQVERRPFAEHSAILDRDPPDMWTLAWSADYPHPHDFLGLLLRSDSGANLGGWDDPRFDDALDAAAATTDPREQQRLYGEAERIARDEAAIVPLGYTTTWALAREGLLGADPAGVGVLRFAALAWSP
jgi:oligopeptide transport system substrate-binding protein